MCVILSIIVDKIKEKSVMELKFMSEPKHTLNCMEYSGLWSIYGREITKAFEKVTSLSFKENVIEAIVGDYPSNFAGNSCSDPMLFRFSVRHKIGTLFHELSHRLLLEYHFLYKGVVENDHELIDLFLFDVIEEAFGVDAACERMAYEITFPELEISQAWKAIMCYSQQERHKLWCDILTQSSLPK